MALKAWAPLSYTAANILSTFGFLMGSLPAVWDKETHLFVLIASKKWKIRWGFTVAFMMFWQFLLVGYFIFVEASRPEFGFKSIATENIVNTCIAFTGALLNVHSLLKYKQIVHFINSSSKYYEWFQGKGFLTIN